MDPSSRLRIGDILLESGRLTEAQLQEALERKTPSQKLGQALQEMGLLSEQDLVEIISKQMGIPALDSEMFLIDPAVVELIPEKLARRYLAIPLFLVDGQLTVGMADPLDLAALDELTRASGYPAHPVVASESAIRQALDEYYAVGQSLAHSIEAFEGDSDAGQEGLSPAARIVNQIVFQAVKLSASDIHIEPREKDCRVRFRIDGVLHEILNPAKQLADPVVSRLKILANLDISEKRLPQDGRFSITVGSRFIDVRLSTLPISFGEKVVLRILDKSASAIGLDYIGLDGDEHKTIRSLLSNPYGLLLVTGPTGSGKTTTLYGMLKHVSAPEKNIITVEDPVEYQVEDINQVQVNPKVNLTFSRGLRSILRQDPDIIMVGEIRDEETAAIAIRAALTGHFVLSTLHTNDAISSVGRLLDMGVKPYLLTSSLVGVVAQRLIRKVCEDCARHEKPTPEFLAQWGIEPGRMERVAVARGCGRCNKTGYRGRTAVFEILEMNESLRGMILESKSSIEIQRSAEKRGLSLLRDAAVRKMIQGLTTPEELARVIAASEG